MFGYFVFGSFRLRVNPSNLKVIFGENAIKASDIFLAESLVGYLFSGILNWQTDLEPIQKCEPIYSRISPRH